MTEEKEQEATYGSGEQIVENPDKPTQLQKENPKNELPEKVVDAKTGKMLNLDTEEITNPEIIEVDGVKIDVSEFGPGGIFWLHEMYEQWLAAVQTDQCSTFCANDEGGVNSAVIIELYKRHYPPAGLSMLKTRTRTVKNDDGNDIRRVEKYIAWTRDTTLEQWIAWTAANLRWRIKYEFDERQTKLGFAIRGLPDMKEACENCLVAAEKFLASSERRRLTLI